MVPFCLFLLVLVSEVSTYDYCCKSLVFCRFKALYYFVLHSKSSYMLCNTLIFLVSRVWFVSLQLIEVFCSYRSIPFLNTDVLFIKDLTTISGWNPRSWELTDRSYVNPPIFIWSSFIHHWLSKSSSNRNPSNGIGMLNGSCYEQCKMTLLYVECPFLLDIFISYVVFPFASLCFSLFFHTCKWCSNDANFFNVGEVWIYFI